MSVRLVSLTIHPPEPASDSPVWASCVVVNDDVKMTVPVLCIAVRDSSGRRYDFPAPSRAGMATGVEVEYRSGERSFPAGAYRVFPAYRHPDGRWISLPSQSMTVGGTEGV